MGWFRGSAITLTALTDAGWAVVESYRYSAFGTPRLIDSSGTEISPPCSALGNPFGFAGLRWDAEARGKAPGSNLFPWADLTFQAADNCRRVGGLPARLSFASR